MIDDYNLHMGGVDKSDQLVLYYGYSHRSQKWWKRVSFRLLDLKTKGQRDKGASEPVFLETIYHMYNCVTI